MCTFAEKIKKTQLLMKEKKEEKEKKEVNCQPLSLKNLTKSSVWDIQENDIFRMMDGAEKDAEIRTACAIMSILSAAPS